MVAALPVWKRKDIYDARHPSTIDSVLSRAWIERIKIGFDTNPNAGHDLYADAIGDSSAEEVLYVVGQLFSDAT